MWLQQQVASLNPGTAKCFTLQSPDVTAAQAVLHLHIQLVRCVLTVCSDTEGGIARPFVDSWRSSPSLRDGQITA